MKNIPIFYLKIFGFLDVKFSIYLNRRVFVMKSLLLSPTIVKELTSINLIRTLKPA